MRSSSMRKRDLSPRAGGGGGGRGGGGGGGGKSGGSSGSSGGSSGAGRSSPISSGGTSRSATPFGSGGGPVTTIPSGQMFAGRTAGGGTRNQVYGTSQYGSGYPNQAGRGVAGRGFPFVFWPLAWGGAAGAGGAGYLHNREYGNPDNSSRPGGPMVTATFASSTSNTTFHLVADKQTVVDLIQDIRDGCSSKSLATDKSSTSPSPYNDTDPSSPKPESTIQYYRASSVALTLDGYNNSAALAETEGQPDTPLPSNIDTTLKDCLNQTIGAAVPLIGGAEMRWAAPNVGILALVWVFLHLTTAI